MAPASGSDVARMGISAASLRMQRPFAVNTSAKLSGTWAQCEDLREDIAALLPKGGAQEAADRFFQAEEVVAGQLRAFVLMNAARDVLEVPDVGKISLDHFSNTVQARWWQVSMLCLQVDAQPAAVLGSTARLRARAGDVHCSGIAMFDRRYEKLQILGSGAYGTALLVRERAGGGTKYVAKEINAAHLGEKDRREQERQLALAEADVLRRVCHANIIRYVESFMEGPKLYIVMEYADNGDLATQIKRRRFTEDQIMHIHLQLILALSHIHDCKILHRDLTLPRKEVQSSTLKKPLNIFLTRRWIVKLGDFGISKVLESTTAGAQTTIGTPLYLAPEICNGDSYGVKSDLWALGVVTYELAALQVPFQATSMVALIMKVCSAEPAPLPAVYSQDLAEIVSGLLEKEPRKRLALEDVLRLGYARHHMQSLLERSRDMAREVQAPVRTQKPAPHPLAPGSPASQDPAQAVRNEYFLNKEIARRNKERCRGPASLSPERSDPRPDPSLQVPRAAPRAASAPRAPPREPPREPPEPEDKRAEVRRRSQEARAAEEAAWKKRLEEARRQVVQDKMVAKQRMEQDYRSRFGGPEPSERSVSSDASPNATRPSERRSESERSGSSDLSPGAPQTTGAQEMCVDDRMISRPVLVAMAMMSMPIRRRVRAALLLALGVCALWSFQAHQAFGSATVVEVKEEPSTMVKFVGGHPLLVCFVVMALTGAFACTEVSQATPAGPPEKRPDYNTFLMMQNILSAPVGRLIMNGGAAFFNLMAAFAAGSFVAGYSKSDGEAVYQGRYSPNMLASTFCVLGGCLVHYCKASDGTGNDSHSEPSPLPVGMLGCVVPPRMCFADVLRFPPGIQNGVTRRCTSCPICTTHFTGYLTDFGVGLGAWARAQVSGEPSPTLLKVLLFGSGTFFFGLGGVAAKETHGPYGIQAALIPAAIMAAVAGGLLLERFRAWPKLETYTKGGQGLVATTDAQEVRAFSAFESSPEIFRPSRSVSRVLPLMKLN
eukprot:s4877_g2.t1